MAKGHISRKELKQDVMQEFGRRAIDYIERHQSKILTIALVILALIILIPLGMRSIEKLSQSKMLDLSKAREDVRLAAGTVDATRKQKIENAIKAADDLRKSYGNTEIGTESLFIKGNALYLKQDYDGAISAYQEYVKETQDKDNKAKGQIAIGYCFEDKAFGAKESESLQKSAAEAYQSAIDLGSTGKVRTYHAYEGMMDLARLAASSGDIARATDLYKQVISERPPMIPPEKNLPDSTIMDQLTREEQTKIIREGLRRMRTIGFAQIAESRLELLNPAALKAIKGGTTETVKTSAPVETTATATTAAVKTTSTSEENANTTQSR